MRFMMMVYGTADYENGTPPPPELMQAIAALGEKARKAGKMIMEGGLKPARASARIRMKGGKRSVVDGPFAETKELVGGFAIMELGSMEEAKASAQEFLDAHEKAGIRDLTMDIRPLFGPEDFGICPGT